MVELVVVVVEAVAFVSESLVIELEVLAVDEVQEGLPGHQHVEDGEPEEDEGERVGALPDLHVEDQFSQEAPEEGEVQQEEALHGQIARDVALETGAAEEVVLVDPVVDAEAAEDEEGADGDEVGVEEGEPHHLDQFGVALPHVVVVVGHEVIGLVLRDVAATVVVGTGVGVAELEGVDGPDEGDEEGAEDEHDGLLLDDPEVVLVVVLELERLHHDGHQRSREEHAQRVLEGEGEVLVGLVVVLLQVREVVQHVAHHELVEEHDAQQRRPCDYGSDHLLRLGSTGVGVLLLLLDRRHQVVRLYQLQHVEDHRGGCQEEQTQSPSQQDVLGPSVGVLQVLIDDLSGFGSLLDDDGLFGVSEVAAQLALLLVAVHLVQEVLLLRLGLEDDDGIGGSDGVAVDLLDGLVHHLVPLVVQLLQVFELVLQMGLPLRLGVQVVFQCLLLFLVDLMDAF